MNNGANTLIKWQHVADHVLAPILAEEAVHEEQTRFERAAYEYGLLSYHMPPGPWRALWQAVLKLRIEGKPLHQSTILEACQGGVDSAWLTQRIALYSELVDGAVFNANLENVIKYGERARIRDSLTEATTDIDNGGDPDDITTRLMTRLAQNNSAQIVDEIAADNGADFATYMQGSSENLVKTHVPVLDGWLGGIGEDDVLAIVGPYKMRKSTLMRIIAYNIVNAGGSVAILMLESTRRMVVAQFVAMYAVEWLYRNGLYDSMDQWGQPLCWISGKDLVRIREGYRKWDKRKVQAVDYGIQRYRELGTRLRIYDKGRTTGALSNLASVKRVIMRDKHLYEPQLVAVDHLQRINEPGNDYEVMFTASRTLETMARHEKIAMCLLSQVSEQEIKSGQKSHSPGVKGGGDLSAAVDYLFTVHYGMEDDFGKVQKDRMTVKMHLSRYGEGGVSSDIRIDPFSGLLLPDRPTMQVNLRD